MFPSVIGGHCVILNIELLLKVYDSEFLRLILKLDEKRKEDSQKLVLKTFQSKLKLNTMSLCLAP